MEFNKRFHIRFAIGPGEGNKGRIFAFGRFLDHGIWLMPPEARKFAVRRTRVCLYFVDVLL